MTPAIKSLPPAFVQQLTKGFHESLKGLYMSEFSLPPTLHQGVMDAMERALLITLMKRRKGCRVWVAVRMGINRNTLLKKLRTHGLDGIDWKNPPPDLT